ncbi:MAG: HU family DNA-binding protein [Caulobacterales bacterium]
MTISELIDHIAADAKVTKAQAKSLIDSVFGAIHHAAGRGAEVSIPGFGKFKVQHKPARTGRNPRTGAAVKIAASKKVVFQPAKALKEHVNK